MNNTTPLPVWFIYAVTATFLYGMMNFMFKLGARKGCSSSLLLNRSAATVATLSGIFLFISGDEFSLSAVMIYALINSSFFAAGNLCKITALKKAPAATVFPVTKLNAAFVIIFSIIVYGDRPHLLQWLGLILSFSVLLLAGATGKKNEKKGLSNEQIGILLALGSALCTSTSMITGRESSRAVSKLAFMFISYTLVAIYTFLINKYVNNKQHKESKKYQSADSDMKHKNPSPLIFGMAAGVFNFSGYYLVLNAFASGEMSLIQGIFSNSFIIPIVLSALFLKEKLYFKHYVMIALTVLSVILIKGL